MAWFHRKHAPASSCAGSCSSCAGCPSAAATTAPPAAVANPAPTPPMKLVLPTVEKSTMAAKLPTFTLGRFAAVAIASSTGGPGLVERIIAGLPADLPVPIFIAQHLPPQFTAGFAAQLDRAGALSTLHAEDGMPIVAGTIYVGPGRRHLRVRRAPFTLPNRVQIEVSPDPAHLHYKPSADELFRSLAQVYGPKVLAIVLTGIGRDGCEGARAVVDAGGIVLTQSAQSCAVYGMPRSVYEAGLSTAQLDPADLTRAILQLSPGHRAQAILA